MVAAPCSPGMGAVSPSGLLRASASPP